MSSTKCCKNPGHFMGRISGDPDEVMDVQFHCVNCGKSWTERCVGYIDQKGITQLRPVEKA